MIKPIETFYDGYRFRSRLEARSAVMFDCMGLRFQYEPQGYKLKNGTCYLPDFYLPDIDAHVEVKANTPSGVDDVKNKCFNAIEWGGPIKRIIIISEIPDPDKCEIGLWHFPAVYSFDAKAQPGWWYFEDWEDRCSGAISHSPYPWWSNLSPKLDTELGRNALYASCFFNAEVMTTKAYKKARQARFEHGEKPTI